MTPTRIVKHFIRFDDGTCWPRLYLDDADDYGIEHCLRYGEPSKSDLLVAAAYIEAYQALLRLPVKRRNEVCKAIRDAEAAHLKEGDQ